jgi:type I restriction enzyme S subunit
MFGDPATNPKGWKTAAVEEGLSRERPGMRCGPFGTALRKEEYVSEGIPVWGIENVQPNLFLEEGSLFISEDKYSELSAYSVHSGDVLISRAGTVGRMCVARPRQQHSVIGTNLIRVALDQTVIAPDYFTALFTYFADRVAGLRASSDDGAYSFLQTGVLRHVRVPLPPIEKQRAYAEFVEVTRRNQTRRNAGLQASDLLFYSLVQRAFRGEL